MPRIKLAFWHGKHSPGDEVDVTDVEFAALRRDGRVADVLDESATSSPTPAAEPEPAPEPAGESEAPAAEGRGRKAR